MTRKTNDGSAMKCNAPVDPETGMVLQGDELAAAISTERVAFCSNEVDGRDVFCSRYGARCDCNSERAIEWYRRAA